MNAVCINHIPKSAAAKSTQAQILIFKNFPSVLMCKLHVSTQTHPIISLFFPLIRLILTRLKKLSSCRHWQTPSYRQEHDGRSALAEHTDGFARYLSGFCRSTPAGLVPLSVHSHNPGLNNLHTTRLHCLCCVCICTSQRGPTVHQQHLSFGRAELKVGHKRPALKVSRDLFQSQRRKDTDFVTCLKWDLHMHICVCLLVFTCGMCSDVG